MTTPPTIASLHRRVAAIAACAAALAVSAAAGEPATPRRVVVDPQVTAAGGHGCRNCGSGQCQLHGHGGPRHHPECRDGMCVPHCPVRPSTFGFYGTQWRRWPGPGVVPASAEDAVTPMPPPKSAVPGPDEESPARPDEGGEGLEPRPDAGAEDRADARDDVVVPDAEVPAEPMTPKKPQPPIDIVPEPTPAVREKSPAVLDEPATREPAAPKMPSAPQRLPSLDDIIGGAEPSPGASAEPMQRAADGPAAPKAEGPKPGIPADIFDEDDAPAADPANDGRDEGVTPDRDADNPFEDDSASTSDRGVELAGFRYPTAVGGSLEPGGRPWQLAPQKQKRQRAAGSPRGR